MVSFRSIFSIPLFKGFNLTTHKTHLCVFLRRFYHYATNRPYIVTKTALSELWQPYTALSFDANLRNFNHTHKKPHYLRIMQVKFEGNLSQWLLFLQGFNFGTLKIYSILRTTWSLYVLKKWPFLLLKVLSVRFGDPLDIMQCKYFKVRPKSKITHVVILTVLYICRYTTVLQSSYLLLQYTSNLFYTSSWKFWKFTLLRLF